MTLEELAKQQEEEEGELQIDYEEFIKFKELSKQKEAIITRDRGQSAGV